MVHLMDTPAYVTQCWWYNEQEELHIVFPYIDHLSGVLVAFIIEGAALLSAAEINGTVSSISLQINNIYFEGWFKIPFLLTLIRLEV